MALFYLGILRCCLQIVFCSFYVSFQKYLFFSAEGELCPGVALLFFAATTLKQMLPHFLLIVN